MSKLLAQTKTINIRHSLVVTHPSTTRTFRSLYMGDRTGTLIFCELWSIAAKKIGIYRYIDGCVSQPGQRSTDDVVGSQ